MAKNVVPGLLCFLALIALEGLAALQILAGLELSPAQVLGLANVLIIGPAGCWFTRGAGPLRALPPLARSARRFSVSGGREH